MLTGSFSARAAETYLEVGGLLVIEAEGYHSKANTSLRDWYIFPATGTPTPDPDGPHATGTGGGQYVEILPDTLAASGDPLEYGTNFFETGVGAPRMDYQVNITTPGRYYGRFRAYSTGTDDNGVHIGVDNIWPLSGTAVQWCDGKNSWYWSAARRVPEDHCGITNGIYLDLTAGVHTIMIAMREDGFELDRFVLTTDSNYFPTGVGPAKSPVSSGGDTAQIVTQPQSPVNLNVGGTLTLSVTATGTGPITYQWTKGGINISGATSAVYTKNDVQVSDSGTYAVKVTNPSGTVASTGSQVTVSQTPSDYYIEAGGLLVIEAEGYHSKANTSVRDWYIFPTTGTPTPDPDGPHETSDTGDGQYVEALPDTRTVHEDPLELGTNVFETGVGAPRMNYVVNITTPGRYYARVRGYTTGEDDSAHLGVDNTWPSSGEDLVWSCIEVDTWIWLGNRRFPDNKCGITNEIYLDLTAGFHTIMIAMREDGAELDRFVLTTDPDYFPTGIGPAASQEFLGEDTADIVTQPQSPVNLLIGDTLTLSVTATGTEPITYQWTKGGVNIPGATSAVYTKTNVQESDSGSYAVKVTNPSGTVTSSSSQVTVTPFTLWNIVESTPELSMFEAAIQAAGLVPALRQGTLTLFTPNNAAFAALPAGVWDEILADSDQLLAVLSYHALDDIKTTAQLVPGLYQTLQGSDVVVTVPGAGVLMVNNAEVIEGDLLASNGSAHVIDAVLLPDTAEIVTQPQSPVTVAIGDTLTLSVTATGTGPITYQWTKGGVNIPGATSATYSKTNFQDSDSGTYAVKVTNPSGTVTSSNALVSVTRPTLWRILETTPELSTFKAAMEAAGLVQVLQRPGTLTLFSPTDAAFAALPAGVWDEVLADPEQLLAVLSYHGVAGGRTTAQLVPGAYRTLQGSNVVVTVPEVGVLMVNEAEVTVGDQLASNGVAHLIDAVLLLPEPLQIVTQPESLVAAFVGHTITLSVVATGAEPIQYQWTKGGVNIPGATSATLVMADAQISDSGLYTVKITSPGGAATSSGAAVTVFVPTLWDIVALTPELSTFKAAIETAGLVQVLQRGSLTLFVPTDTAFASLPAGEWDAVLADPERLLATLSYHALDDIMTTAQLVPGAYQTLQGSNVVVTVPEVGVLMVNEAEVTVGDQLASNGVAHLIDAVLLLPEPLQIVTQPETLVAAYVGDTITLSVVATGAEPIQYQWTKGGVNIPGATSATFVMADAQIPNSGVYAVKITSPGGTVTSSDAAVTVTVPTLWQLLESNPELSTLKAAVEAAGLVETLQGAEELTLFTPNNAAFEALPEGVWDELLANPELLLGALTYHALAGTQTTVELVSGDYETLNGANVTVTAGEVLTVNDAEVIAADQLASNGVAHVIDAVLLLDPPQIVTQPETPVAIYVGDAITLAVEATGADPIQYQWTKDGVDLEGATSATFEKADAQVSDSGLYAVKVTNPGGTLTSSDAAVTVTVPTLWQILESNPELSTLKAAVEAAGLVETLEGETALTLFAPNNAAFEALPEGVWDELLANPELLLGALTYHALAGAQTTVELVSGDYETLNGASVTVVAGEVMLVNDAEVIAADQLASNGVAHVIDAVLLLDPPQIVTQPETPVAVYVGDAISLSVEATGADPIQYQWTKDGVDLEGATSATFEKADAQVSDSGLYAVKVTNPGGTVTSSDAAVTVTVPTLWQILESNPELSTLKAAVEAAGLVETLEGETALTLFAPNNAAFEALPEGVWDELLANPELLLGALTYHALAGAQTTVELVSGDYETLNGASVTVVAGEVMLVNDAEVIAADQLASNGVAHVIDAVLLLDPPQIVTQPETPVAVYVGDAISLSVEATGADPIQYQWTKDGVDLEGETSATFEKADAQVSDSGLYAVKVTNPGGTVTSSDAAVTVTVSEPPLIGPPAIVDGNFTITWTGGGELETATDVSGPWEPTGNTSGSFTEPVGSGTRFYRIGPGE